MALRLKLFMSFKRRISSAKKVIFFVLICFVFNGCATMGYHFIVGNGDGTIQIRENGQGGIFIKLGKMKVKAQSRTDFRILEILAIALSDDCVGVREVAKGYLDEIREYNERKQRDEFTAVFDKKDSSGLLPGIRVKVENLFLLDPVSRGQAAFDLGEMGAEAAPAVPFLIARLGDDTSQLVWLIERKGETGSADNKVIGMGGNTSVGKETMKALVKIGDPAVRPLIMALESGSLNIRERAAIALGCLETEQAIGPLIAALKKWEWGSCPEIGEVLKKVKENSKVPNIVYDEIKNFKQPYIVTPSEVRNDAENSFIRECVEALKKITDRDFGEDPDKWQEWWGATKQKVH